VAGVLIDQKPTKEGTMHITIPAGTTMERFGASLAPLSAWLTANGVDPAKVAGDIPLELTGTHISAGIRPWPDLPVDQVISPIKVPMPQELLNLIASIFGGVFEGSDPRPVRDVPEPVKEASLDDISAWIEQLEEARMTEKAAKERAEEARTAIVARLREAGAEYGTVNGQRVVKAKTIESSRFKTAEFRKAHPQLADEYTSVSTSVRLEII
jgi:hypothetical protein